MLRFDYKIQDRLGMEMFELGMYKDRNASIVGPIRDGFAQGLCMNEDIVSEMVAQGYVKTEEEAVRTLFYMSLFGDELDSFVFNTYFKDGVKIQDVAEFRNNPYIQKVKFDTEININNVSLGMGNFKKYEVFENGFISRNKKFITTPNVGFFDEDVLYPAISQDNRAWMTVTPSEINTMKEDLKAMKGDIVVFGLGLGYFAYMSALKSDVPSVTIVEKDSDIIEIFNSYILPQFEEAVRSKIKVINADAKELYLDKEFMGGFKTCYIDIWRTIKDGIELYAFFKEHEKVHKVKTRYWIEKEFALRYQDAMLYYALDKLTSSFHAGSLDPYMQFIYAKIDNYFSKKTYKVNDKLSLDKLIYDKKIRLC